MHTIISICTVILGLLMGVSKNAKHFFTKCFRLNYCAGQN